jgi:hypothetical protein
MGNFLNEGYQTGTQNKVVHHFFMLCWVINFLFYEATLKCVYIWLLVVTKKTAFSIKQESDTRFGTPHPKNCTFKYLSADTVRFNQVLLFFLSSFAAVSLRARAFYYFIPHTAPFNYGAIEIEIKSYHMGPILAHICIPPALGTFQEPHTNHAAAAERKKKCCSPLIETDGI